MTITAAKIQPFQPVTPLAPATGPAPKVVDLPWQQQATDVEHLVSVRYQGLPPKNAGGTRSTTARNDFKWGGGEEFHGVSGSLDDAISAARQLAVREGDVESPGHFARTSVAVLATKPNEWQVARLSYADGMHDGMDAIISMPVDTVAASKSDVSVPYGDPYYAAHFDEPSRVTVRFNDPRVAAVVGVDSISRNPAFTVAAS